MNIFGGGSSTVNESNVIRWAGSTFVKFRNILLNLRRIVVRRLLVVSILCASFAASIAFAHGGGLAADGCHNDRKNGGRHCHGGSEQSPRAQRAMRASTYFPNCAAARAEGAAPVRAGQPGYGKHLDRDGDGVGCE